MPAMHVPDSITIVTAAATAVGAVLTASFGIRKAWTYFWEVYVPRRMRGQASLKAVPAIQSSLDSHSKVLESQNRTLQELMDLTKRGQESNEARNKETTLSLNRISSQVEGVIRRQDTAEARATTDSQNQILSRKTIHHHGKVLQWVVFQLGSIGKHVGFEVTEPPESSEEYLAEEWDRLSSPEKK